MDWTDAGSDMQLSESESEGMEVDECRRGRQLGLKGEDGGLEEEEEEEEVDDDDDDDDDNGDDDHNDDGAEEEEDEEEDEDNDDRPGTGDHSHTPSPPPQRPRLKIKLRLPAHPSSSSNTASTPARTPDASRTSSRRAPSADLDVESEDENDPGGDKDQSRSTPSTSVTASGRPMTTRQAVLASVVDSTHVSLSETSRKKKPLNDAELALRREETARKRKNLSEKKLEDEKAETINRLLKKQSRSKNKRSGLYIAEDRTPHSSSHPPTNTNTGAPSTPVPQSLLRQGTHHTDWDGEGDPDLDVLMDPEMAVFDVPAVPEMYRWISTSKSRNGGEDGANATERTMSLSFSVPTSVTGAAAATTSPTHVHEESPSLPIQTHAARCDVDGCTELRKYRLVQDWTRGACGMPHLKVLELEVT